jgi:hypothetical protein
MAHLVELLEHPVDRGDQRSGREIYAPIFETVALVLRP